MPGGQDWISLQNQAGFGGAGVADNLIEGVGGGEAEASEAPEGDGAGLDPVAAALAVLAIKAGEPLDPRLVSYLEEQTGQLREQRALRLSHLRSQSREGKIRRASARIRVGMQLFTALIATVIGGGLLIMLNDAFTSHSVVVDAFKTPPTLASRGMTGEVVASDVLDTLQKLQAATRAEYGGLSALGAWASDVKVEVPETGVSIGEINRLLHERFGHDLHIGGDLIQTETGGLVLTVRGDGVAAATFTGGAGDLDKLTTQAAEYVYGRSQPYQYATYLIGSKRGTDALAFLPGAFAQADSDLQRAQLANTWGNAYAILFQPARAVEKYRLAMTFVRPRTELWWKAWCNLIGSLSAAGGEEAGWRDAHAFLQVMAEAPKRDRPPMRLVVNPAQVTWDLRLLLAATLKDAALHGGAGAAAMIEGPTIADTYGLMHDPAQAARYMALSDPDDPSTKVEALLLQGYAALDRGDARAAVGPLEAFDKAWLADPSLQFTYTDSPCLTGLAYGLTGRTADAEAIFKRLGSWSRCNAARGDMLAHVGDVAGAQQVWADGVKMAPHLPFVFLDRGRYELDHGEFKAAEADFTAASAGVPHFADPLKAWGDVLAREGRWKEALAKYDEALKYAPAWAALHQARDAVPRRS